MAKPNLYFVTTRNCNLKCRHCYLEAGPGKLDTTISPEDFKSVLGNLPKKSLYLYLSGGEIFTIQDQLWSYLKSIKEENIERNYNGQGLIEPGVQTNGSWATDNNKIKSTLDDLASLGVNLLDITSDDEYHREQGIKRDNLERLYVQAEISGLFEDVYLRGAESQHILPIGRARDMDFGTVYLNLEGVCKDFFNHLDLSIREDGKVYPCCYGMHQLPGNIIEEPFDDIISKAEKDERLNILNYEGIAALAVHDGRKRKDVKDLISSYGECGLCAKLYAP